jgi:pyridoxal phosphate enzyme (YggS family)
MEIEMNNSIEEIKHRYNLIQEKVSAASIRSGRAGDRITILTVTKGQPEAVIRNCIEAGIRDFGENYPEESEAKILADQDNLARWHMIGHLQSRKARIVCKNFDMIHSVDRVSLAEKVTSLLTEYDRVLPVLLEMNVAGEDSKSGWDATDPDTWHTLLPDIEKIAGFAHLRVCGLMTMPPYTAIAEDNRNHFRNLAKLMRFINHEIKGLELEHLSMGTSDDYEVAIEEGATFVRIGRAILGPRPPKNQGSANNN